MASRSAYNQKNNDEEDEKPSNRCPANDCFMAASLSVEGAPFACRYHAKQPNENWPKVTSLLHTHKRLLDIIANAEAMKPDEFDLLRNKSAFELEEMLKPVKGETHRGWKLRIKDFVYKAIQNEINKIESQGKTTLERAVSYAVNAFTNGTLRKQQRPKSFRDMDGDA